MKKLKKPNMISKRSDDTDLKAMLKGLRAAKAFDIVKDSETVVVTHKRSSFEVLRGIRNGKVWIVRLADNLFGEPVRPVTAADMF